MVIPAAAVLPVPATALLQAGVLLAGEEDAAGENAAGAYVRGRFGSASAKDALCRWTTVHAWCGHMPSPALIRGLIRGPNPFG
jgi:hypothetical protein